ncbi:MAG: S53 family peptidase [Motilibacteraceae bacterium]
MKIRPALAAAGAAALLAGAWTGTAAAAPSTTGQTARSEHVCAKPTPGLASCHAIVRTDITGNGNRNNGKPGGGGGGTPVPPTSGYRPSDIQSAYNLAGLDAKGATVAIVDAYDDPNAEADLAYYRTALNLPACTTANGCFRKVNQTGGTSYPRANGGWAQEISLDVDMVSAACPTCKILLVEANSASFADLGTAVDTAARLGAVAISNSYGGSDSAAGSAYDHPGIAITASTGDNGYGVESPASFGTVVAVGGTSLKKASTSRGWTESAWSGAGSGCSTLNAKPSWQTSATQCSGKANADVSAVADPNTGVAVYDSYAYQGGSGWLVFGGTSASSPIVASVYALSGNTSGYPASYTWGHAGGLNDVTSGSNGSCSTAVWCNAGAGWDGPTGLGTPNGTSAF